MKNIHKFLFMMLLLSVGYGLSAQSLTVRGKLTDQEGVEIVGAYVSLKNSSETGTICGVDGNYELVVPNADKAVLVYSCMGFKTTEIELKGQQTIDVVLLPDSSLLDEVVVIGYGTSARRDLTGSIVSVRGDELMETASSDVATALAGRVAGVNITQAEGAPGASVSIRVRGGISITQSNEPLYIIDGFPSEDGMSMLDPAEIESIDILKDASSTAIYGARGANGVVLITTKKGGKGEAKLNVSFDAYVGVRKVAKKLPVLNVEEFVLLDYERSLNAGAEDLKTFQNRYGSFMEIHENYADRQGIDWQEEALGRLAATQNYRVRVAGGTKDLKYSMSYSYFKDLGAMIQSGSDKHNVSVNLSHRASDFFSVNGKVNYSENTIYGMGTSEGNTRFNKMEHILQYRPVIGLYGSDSELLWGADPISEDDFSNPMQSPLISAKAEKKNQKTRSLQTNAGFTLNFTGNFSFTNSTGFSYRTSRLDLFNGKDSSSARRSSINGQIQYNEAGVFQTSNVLNYRLQVNNHNMAFTLGQEYIASWSKYVRSVAVNFPNDDIGLNDMNLGTPQSILSGTGNDSMLSFFARANYNYKEKYILTATLRADGSSKFSARNKWGVFPSVSAAWRLVEEDFIKNLNVFSDLKLKAGYGLAGNNCIADYASLDLLKSVQYPAGENVSVGYVPVGIPSSELKWESNATFNLGLDMGFFYQRLTVSPEFYINRSSQLLLNSRVPLSSGFKTMLRNVGNTRNMGVDLTINSVNIENRNFTWSTAFNISYNKNTILALSGEKYFLEEAGFGYNLPTHKIEVGKSIGQIFGYVTEGVYGVDDFIYDAENKTYTLKDGIAFHGKKEDVRPGMWKFKDLDDDGSIDDGDRNVIGNAMPLFYGGLNNTFRYKGWELGLFFTFSYGAKVLNATKLTNTKAGKPSYNVLNVVNSGNRWMTINGRGEIVTDPAELAALNAGKSIAAIYDLEQSDQYIHSWAVEDASFLRLSNVNLSYNFNRNLLKKIHLSGLKLYFTANNVFVATPYSGFDPEVSTKGNSLTPGVDYGAYPRSRSFIFGINLMF